MSTYFSAAWHLGLGLVEAGWLAAMCRPEPSWTGPAILVPVAIMGKFVGAKISLSKVRSRITELSLTGKIMLRLADLFFVQWEPLQRRYPRTIYAGRLM